MAIVNTTPRKIIRQALRICQVLGPNEDPSSPEENDALEAMNDLLSLWSSYQILFYEVSILENNFISNKDTYELGTTGDFYNLRPTYIDTIFINDTDKYYQLKYLGREDFYEKKSTIKSRPAYFMYENSMENGTLFISPVPDKKYPVTLHLYNEFTKFNSATQQLNLPAPYEYALKHH